MAVLEEQRGNLQDATAMLQRGRDLLVKRDNAHDGELLLDICDRLGTTLLEQG